MHVDDWLDNGAVVDGETLRAKEFLEEARKPAVKIDREWMKRNPLFCKWRGQMYRCTGASCMGDVWLTHDFSRSVGYDLRVNVTECSDWCRPAR